MKRILFVLLIMALMMPVAMAQPNVGEYDVVAEDSTGDVQEVVEVFNVFTDKWANDNHYSPSGWMGDHGDIQIDDTCKNNPHTGQTCFQVKYSGKKTQNAGWIGMFWQNPPNNWGDQMGGYDLTEYSKLTFWARGDNGGEVVSEFKMGGIGGMYSDSDSSSITQIVLSTEWKQYEIDLSDLDLSYISGGFCLTASSVDNPEGFIIYLDDIRYEK
jgi:hypothetical protein